MQTIQIHFFLHWWIFQVFQNWKMWYGLFYIFKAGGCFFILGKYLWLLMMFLVHHICCTFYKFQCSFIYYFTFNLQQFCKIARTSQMICRWWWGSENFNKFSVVTKLDVLESGSELKFSDLNPGYFILIWIQSIITCGKGTMHIIEIIYFAI